ncbi:MAG: AAA family ATPase [Treponema sp.]|jgi:AAA+ ATPase superfamily predicted ATPase|nr:AAA family ATPase [Treponema sp.]
MKFYDRTGEIGELRRIRNLSFNDHARMTVVTGRRRIGKTVLIAKAMEDAPVVYFFVGRKNEAPLCAEFAAVASQALGAYIPGEVRNFQSLFRYLMESAEQRPFTLVIDEFQEFVNINGSVYSDMQNIWDRHKDRSRMNLILCGSVYSLMEKIFKNSKEPLFGRADNILRLSPFNLGTLKEILKDHRPGFRNDDLLAFYAFTGGIPKYIELLCGNSSLTVNGMIDFMVRKDSPFIEEGKYLLIEEFDKNYGMYFSILSAVSAGINTQGAIEAAVGDKSTGGQIRRLIEDYRVLSRKRPLLAKEGTHAVRYEIADNFLQFWFNFFDRYRSLIEVENFPALNKLIKANYQTYSGRILERYFRQQLSETGNYRAVGGWWLGRRRANAGEEGTDQHKIDILALRLEENRALAVEVKRQKKKFNPALLNAKIEFLERKVLPGYEIEGRCLSLEDM